jgi:DNA-binding SARP family transcriptional activator
MQIRLLGRIHLRTGGRELDAGPRQRCHVLAVLAADAQRVVSTEALIERVWDDPPVGARSALHVHIACIRQLLRAAAGEASPVGLLRRGGGYLLDIDPDDVDVHRMRRLTGRANRAGTGAVPATLLREAVGLWRGEPLCGLTGSWAARTRYVWHRHYLETVVAWAEVELALGNHAAVVGPLTALCAENPLVESLSAVFMRALCQGGRSAEALEHFAGVRQRLTDDLGTDPGAELREVHRAVLRGELDPPRVAAAGATRLLPARVVPAQLPTETAGFTGRAAHLAEFDAVLRGAARDAVTRAETGSTILAVSGTAGVGKTALAVHWAHRAAPRFPDGQLYVDLRGFAPGGRAVAPVEAARGFLHALGVPPDHVPTDPPAAEALYRSLVAGRRMLVVLDNARDAAHVRPLLPGAATALVVVTSRSQLTPLLAVEGAHHTTLGLLTAAESRELLARRLGAERLAAEPGAVEAIIAACENLPLALAVVAARARQSGFRLRVLAAELSGAGPGAEPGADPGAEPGISARLDALDAGDPSTRLRAVFDSSYAALTPPAARLFRLLGPRTVPDVSIATAARLVGGDVAGTRRTLAELTRASLLVEHSPGRYTCHGLLRAYASELAERRDGCGEPQV